MEFRELSDIWKSNISESEKSYEISSLVIKDLSTKKIKSSLREIKLNSIFEIVCYFLFTSFLIDYITEELTSPRFLIPGIALFVFCLFGLVWNIYMIYLYTQVDATKSVLETQRSLERLRYYEQMDINTLYFAVPVFSLAFFIVIARDLIGVDLYEIFGIHLLYYAIGSFLVGLIIIFFLKRFPNKKLQESIAFLKDLKEYEER